MVLYGGRESATPCVYIYVHIVPLSVRGKKKYCNIDKAIAIFIFKVTQKEYFKYYKTTSKPCAFSIYKPALHLFASHTRDRVTRTSTLFVVNSGKKKPRGKA